MARSKPLRGVGHVEPVKKKGRVVGYRAVITIHVPGEFKPRRERSTVCATRALALRWLTTLQTRKVDIERGAVPADERDLSVRELAPRLLAWLEHNDERTYTEATLTTYRMHVAAVVADLGDRVVRTLRRGDLTAWVATMRKAGLSPSTIAARQDRLRQMFEVAEQDGLIPGPPCHVPRVTVRQASEPESVTEAVLDKLITAAARDVDRRTLPVLLLGADAGLRRTEILKLDWKDVRLKEPQPDGSWGTILIPQRSATEGPKHGSTRTIPILTRRLHDALEQLWPADMGQVVPEVGSPGGVASLVLRAYRLAGLKPGPQPVHSLRHRFGTYYADRGASPKWIRDTMGHTTLATTERYLRRRGGAIPPEAIEPTASPTANLSPPRKRGKPHQ